MRIIAWIILIFLIYYVFKNRSNLIAFFAQIQYYKGKNISALKMYKFADKFGKLKPEHKIQYAYYTLREGDVDEANKLFNLVGMEKLKPDQRSKLKQSHALVMWKRGDIEEAIEMLEYVHENFVSTTTYGSLGYMYAYNGKLEKALEYNLEAYEYNNSNAIIVDNLAYTYLRLKDYENAEKYYKELFEMEPTFPEGYFEYGKHLINTGKKEEGLELVKKALECRFSFLSMRSRRDIIDYLEAQGEDITKLV